ncbi:DEAD/DEAH box helicase [Aliikangiella maris]|uniref:DEAD/DEAH box helicase n=2 Tax=Aliikangiella maris TaxID=3162458 RepID=A0ABV3MP33_9GAMM
MLVRPLIYKGPVDHLSQHFDKIRLFEGIQVLLDDALMDWQYRQDEDLIRGIFFDMGRPVKTQLMWPIKDVRQTVNCSCDAAKKEESVCRHAAALAIESKVRLERLPPPVKSTENYQSEYHYLKRWCKRQVCDPFPNMARHRVVYLLDHDNSGFSVSIHKAYLTTQNEFKRKAELDWSLMEKAKLPKFVSLTDQEILVEIGRLIKQHSEMVINSNQLRLVFPDCEALLKKIILSTRCFWRSCHRHSLLWEKTTHKNSEKLEITPNVSLDKAKSKILYFDQQKGYNAPLIELLLKAETISPVLTISSEQTYLPWYHASFQDNTIIQLHFAQIAFQVDEQLIGLQEILDSGLSINQPQQAICLEKIAAFVHQVDGIPGIASHFERPVSQHFNLVDRYLEGDLSHWFVLFRGLQCEGWRIRFDDNFELNQKRVDDWYTKVTLAEQSEQPNWFELEVGVSVNGQSINILPYIVKMLDQEQWVVSEFIKDCIIQLDDGTKIKIATDRLQNIINNLIELSEKSPLNINQRLKLSLNQYSRINLLEQTLGTDSEWVDAQWLKEKALKLQSIKCLKKVQSPQNLKAKLRDYQLDGVSWLQFLRQESLGGVLADDMGLGKTIQTLAHLQIEKNQERFQKPVLIVAPTSLLGNWQTEIKRFTPELNVLVWSGVKRKSLHDELHNTDIIITSYGVLLRDFEQLNQLDLYYLILDEAQTIKNSRSKIARVVYHMRATYRLCLTGTPLENHLGELWSLFNFLMPGFLGKESQFKKLFRQPIEKDNDLIRQKILAQRIGPFMLRRTKTKVAADLPDKTIIDEYIGLTDNQTDLYETIRMSMLEEVQTALANSGLSKNKILIGQALLRLRQICCHPALIHLGQSQKHWKHSAKLKWLSLKVPEMIENNQKILIFSSFTSMLDLIAELLDELSIEYLTLTGKTQNRGEIVDRFQQGKIPVFLISLKAGGAGLNLTQADTVIHVDPWWNPAAENQASDRAHRIGQNKPVFIYKLISRGTVEEKIYMMQQKKSQLAEHIYRNQATQDIFNQANWQTLLAPLEN